jgi:FkbM family methyltransferase
MEPALRFNGIRNVTLTPAGLSDSVGRLTLHTPLKRSSALGYGVAHLGAAGPDGDTIDQAVELTTLDLFTASSDLGRIDLIKADVEGWEMRALKGGEDTLARFHPTLYLEIDDALLSRAGDSPSDLFEWLGALGYRGFCTPDLRPTPRWAGAGDYLFTKSEQP